MYYVVNSNELYHHGVKGQKWGVRKESKNANYSTQQRIRDRKIYGEGAEHRINKRMNAGESIQSARHNEVKRKARIENGKKVAKTVAKSALVIGGAAAVATVIQKKGWGKSVATDVMAEEVVNVGRHIINAIFN